MAIAALVGGAGEQGIPKERLAPMLYMADVLAREYLGHPITDIEWTTEAVAALPTKVSFVELAKLLGVEAFFSDSEDGRTSVPSDGINRLRDTLSELQDVLSGSISERETLTAQLLAAHKALGITDLEANDLSRVATRVEGLREAVARLTTERDTFRDWFQNAEQARAVAESRREQAIQDIEALPTFLTELRGTTGSGVSLRTQHVDLQAVLSILRGSNG